MSWKLYGLGVIASLIGAIILLVRKDSSTGRCCPRCGSRLYCMQSGPRSSRLRCPVCACDSDEFGNNL